MSMKTDTDEALRAAEDYRNGDDIHAKRIACIECRQQKVIACIGLIYISSGTCAPIAPDFCLFHTKDTHTPSEASSRFEGVNAPRVISLGRRGGEIWPAKKAQTKAKSFTSEKVLV
jgi:hypothetical protein